MTLDQARDDFDGAPSDTACANYLKEAARYWADGIIDDVTFESIVLRVAEWLADE